MVKGKINLVLALKASNVSKHDDIYVKFLSKYNPRNKELL